MNIENIILVLIYVISHNVIARYKLYKNFNNNKEIMIVNPKKFKTDLELKNEKIKKSNLYGEIVTFKCRLEKNINKEYLHNMYNNLETLKASEHIILPQNLLLIPAGGTYNPKNNKLKILKLFKKEVINHELFHMASASKITKGNKKENIYISGFAQYNSKFHNKLGIGLNEGYTESLNERYFGINTNISKVYKLCEFYSIKLQQIVGEEIMLKLYLTGDLPNLIKELKIYDTKENIIKFITNLDFVFINMFMLSDPLIINKKKLKEKITLKFSEINDTLIKWYIKKKQNELKENKINNIKFLHDINTYYDSIVWYSHFDNNTKKFISIFDYKALEKLDIPTKKIEEYSQVKMIKKRYNHD